MYPKFFSLLYLYLKLQRKEDGRDKVDGRRGKEMRGEWGRGIRGVT